MWAHTGGIGSTALVSLRGSAWNQVNVYLDGVLLNSSLGGAVDISTIPLGDVDHIDVYRGVTPTLFGSSNIGGVIAVTHARAGAYGRTRGRRRRLVRHV